MIRSNVKCPDCGTLMEMDTRATINPLDPFFKCPECSLEGTLVKLENQSSE